MQNVAFGTLQRVQLFMQLFLFLHVVFLCLKAANLGVYISPTMFWNAILIKSSLFLKLNNKTYSKESATHNTLNSRAIVGLPMDFLLYWFYFFHRTAVFLFFLTSVWLNALWNVMKNSLGMSSFPVAHSYASSWHKIQYADKAPYIYLDSIQILFW